MVSQVWCWTIIILIIFFDQTFCVFHPQWTSPGDEGLLSANVGDKAPTRDSLVNRRKRDALQRSLNKSEETLKNLSQVIESDIKGKMTSAEPTNVNAISILNGYDQSRGIKNSQLHNYTKEAEKKETESMENMIKSNGIENTTESNQINKILKRLQPLSVYKNKALANQPSRNISENVTFIDRKSSMDSKNILDASEFKSNLTKKQTFIWDFAQLLLDCENSTHLNTYSKRLDYVGNIILNKKLGNHSSKEALNEGKHCLLTDGPFISKHPNTSIITKNFQCLTDIGEAGEASNLHATFVIYPHDTCMSLDVPRHRMTFSENATCLKHDNDKRMTHLEVRHEVISCVKHKNHTGDGVTELKDKKCQDGPSHHYGFGWLSFLFGLVLGCLVTAAGFYGAKKIKKNRRMRLSEFDSSELTLELDENTAGYQMGQWRRQLNQSPVL